MPIHWDREPAALVARLDKYEEAVVKALRQLLDYFAAKIEAAARQNAPWTDQTGAARAGLRAFAAETATGAVLYLVHSVAYGVYLELAHGGRYAVINQTLEAAYGDIMAAAKRLVA